ncbi:MAG: hypothetical protein Q7K65_02835 [Candidatus Buchananbacteria bacterium]|nr:hypothetical protein [Candidatus Buchananbacteria bacterium]
MSLIRFFRRLSGLVRGSAIIQAPPTHERSLAVAEKPGQKLPESNVVRKKKDWRFSKDEY